jgi:hypothetical protein
LIGILSLNDIVLHAGDAPRGQTPAISADDVLCTLKAIDTHRIPVGL